GAPEGLQRIVTRALTKNIEERYQTAKEVVFDLRRLMQLSESEVDIAVSLEVSKLQVTGDVDAAAVLTAQSLEARRTSSAEYVISAIKRHKRGALIVSAILAIAVVGIAFWFYRFSEQNRSAGHFQAMSMVKLTSGRARGAAISPDGKYVAYVRDASGQRSLWLRQVGTT